MHSVSSVDKPSGGLANSIGAPAGGALNNPGVAGAAAGKLRVDPEALTKAITDAQSSGLRGSRFRDAVAEKVGVAPDQLRDAIRDAISAARNRNAPDAQKTGDARLPNQVAGTYSPKGLNSRLPNVSGGVNNGEGRLPNVTADDGGAARLPNVTGGAKSVDARLPAVTAGDGGGARLPNVTDDAKSVDARLPKVTADDGDAGAVRLPNVTGGAKSVEARLPNVTGDSTSGDVQLPQVNGNDKGGGARLPNVPTYNGPDPRGPNVPPPYGGGAPVPVAPPNNSAPPPAPDADVLDDPAALRALRAGAGTVAVETAEAGETPVAAGVPEYTTMSAPPAGKAEPGRLPVISANDDQAAAPPPPSGGGARLPVAPIGGGMGDLRDIAPDTSGGVHGAGTEGRLPLDVSVTDEVVNAGDAVAETTSKVDAAGARSPWSAGGAAGEGSPARLPFLQMPGANPFAPGDERLPAVRFRGIDVTG